MWTEWQFRKAISYFLWKSTYSKSCYGCLASCLFTNMGYICNISVFWYHIYVRTHTRTHTYIHKYMFYILWFFSIILMLTNIWTTHCLFHKRICSWLNFLLSFCYKVHSDEQMYFSFPLLLSAFEKVS